MSRLIHRNVAGESRRNRSGLILLVVLGMLALFSMLAVTYVVFASQSRSTSMALARRETRGHKSHRAIMDSAMLALVRGVGPESSLFGHSLLEDLYGSAESTGIRLSVRAFQFNPSDFNTSAGMPVAAPQRPMLLNGHFLRIPLNPFDPPFTPASPTVPSPQYVHPDRLPPENDALNGRVITFPAGNGPLSDQSFHIVRYMGQTISTARVTDALTNSNPLTPAELHIFSQSYSITIDLNQANLQQSYVSAGVSGSLADWLSITPAGRNVCYSPAGVPFQLLLNGTPLNAHGVGILADGSSQLHFQDFAAGQPVDTSPRHNSISEMAAGLLPNFSALGRANLTGSTGVLTNANPVDQVVGTHVPFSAQYQSTAAVIPTAVLGDSDEPYDAPDYNTMHMSHRESGATDSSDIIPSFHRPALINYIINWKKDPSTNLPMSPATWTEAEFLATMRRIEMATLRPLSYLIVTPNASFSRNPQFTGGNGGSITSSPSLVVNMAGSWDQTRWSNVYWGTATAPGIFQQWVNSLVLGPWDVDSDLDGVADALLMDPGLPLETAPDGKLLKVLVSYYVDDLDSKLDVNATGSLAQVNDRTSGFYQTTNANVAGLNFQFASPTPGTFANATSKSYWDQGTGYGPADISFRHLFSTGYVGEIAYRNFLMGRYQPGNGRVLAANSPPPAGDIVPGRPASDALAEMTAMRERTAEYRQVGPGLPLGPNGRISIGLDPFGNPRVANLNEWPSGHLRQFTQPVNETTNDPYEATWMRGGNHDSPYSIAEWERIYRVRDADRTLMPERLQAALGLNAAQLANNQVRHWITPYSRALRQPVLNSRSSRRTTLPDAPPHLDSRPFVDANTDGSQQAGEFTPTPLAARGEGATSLMQLVNTIRHMRFQPQFNHDQILQLFPLEFTRGERMNLNRPFGNGVDDGDADGQIDDPSELASAQISQYAIAPGATPSGSGVAENYFEGMFSRPDLVSSDDRLNSLNTDPFLDHTDTTLDLYHGLETRQLFARQLYCLAQLIVPEDYVFPNVNREYFQQLLVDRDGGDAFATSKYTLLRGRILAQWAVNVVDFRDSDSSMTRFVFDPDPFRNAAGADFAAWEVNAMTQTVVWGMEAPEALLTESLALHDIRVRKDPSVTARDEHHQFRTPQGSLFLEMFFPRTTATTAGRGDQNMSTQAVADDLYSEVNVNSDGDGNVKLNLSALAPVGANGAQVPVWRVYISEAVDPAATQSLKTPNERLMSVAAPEDTDEPQRHDLNYQSQVANTLYETSGSPVVDSDTRALYSGLAFDYFKDSASFDAMNPYEYFASTPTERLPDFDPANARVILFTNQTPTNLNTPGVVDPEAQVFGNPNANMYVRGGEYLVIGPRNTTFLGSRTDSKGMPVDGSNFINSPNVRRIQIGSGVDRVGVNGGSEWIELFDNTNSFFAQPTNAQGANWMIAQQDLISYWTNADNNVANAPDRFNGLNVSEPLINHANAYREPTSEVNSSDMDGAEPGGAVDPLPLGFNPTGFTNLPWDAYHDWMTDPTTIERPFDAAHAGTPLENWTPENEDGSPASQTIQVNGGDDVVAPGTQLDFCTAYLQRLADPSKPFHETFNPYITVDWISIDLTVFNGEEDEDDFDSSSAGYNDHFLASRQKIGQTLNPSTHEYGAQTGAANPNGGNSFYSVVTDKPVDYSEHTESPEIAGDPAMWDFALRDMRTATRPTNAHGASSGTTLGFLNSTYNVSGRTDRFVGGPAFANGSGTVRPDALFWPNRQYVNATELMMVPLSSPGQFLQEYSTLVDTTTPVTSVYAPDFKGPLTSDQLPEDRSTPTSPVQTGGAARTLNGGVASIDYRRHTPYSHLMNFLQEVPELRTGDVHPLGSYFGPTTFPATNAGDPPLPNPKNLSLMSLLEMVETSAPWSDTSRMDPPGTFAFRDPSSFAAVADQEMAAASNIIFAPLRAPYNRVSTYVEPGRVNINSVSERTVWQGLMQARLAPGDIDYPPLDWTSSGTVGPEDIDHNGNGVIDAPTPNRTAIDTAATGVVFESWNDMLNSRRGYDQATGATLPGYNPDPSKYNPFFPTRFANPFRPSSEAGMVPKTWSPYPSAPGSTASDQYHNLLAHKTSKTGVLDVLANEVPAYATTLRPTSLDATTFDADGDGTPDSSMGMRGVSPEFLFNDTDAGLPIHPYSDTYQVSRLQKLTTGQSHVYAVYMTVAFFEYDPATDTIGVEYGANAGESERYRGFFVVDRTIPVGFQIGEDHNAANTILVKRYLKARD